MRLEQAVEKLRNLGVYPNAVDGCAELFRDCPTIDVIPKEMSRRRWQSGSEQFINEFLRAVMGQDSVFKQKFLAEAVKGLADSGMQPAHIEEYFHMRGSPKIVFNLDYGQDYDGTTLKGFYARADQFALDKLREWLGFQEDQLE
ncbi:hypothetical protein HYV80_06970 [Candidatus Woesearchaeota archaeon]|nr:hypothetical protein [Candidatus Woesearchaeota archaeon]